MDMDIRPIASEADYDWALEEVAPYFEDEPQPGTKDALRFDVLSALIAHYEAVRWPIDPPDAITAIRFRMEQGNYSQSDLAALLGSRPRASELLSGSRSLTITQIRRLHSEWSIPLEALIMVGAD